MGNSEVGHNAIGCGQIYNQGSKLVNESILSGEIFTTDVWKELVIDSESKRLHLIGLLSDGGVHSHINHLKELIKHAKKHGSKEVYLHILLDGRDVLPTSCEKYIDEIESLLEELNDQNFNAKIASGGGRMYITMDRYEADWQMVKRGWDAHVLGIGRKFVSATEAVKTYREELNCTDQDLKEFVITENGKPVGTIEDGDSVIFFNFRGDRAIEISTAFEQEQFDKFDRVRTPKVKYAGLLQYDGDKLIPKKYLVNPPKIEHTLTEFLIEKNVKQYAISETQKYGHVTYFWNGNRENEFSETLETWQEIESDKIPFDQKPEMKAVEITDALITAINKNEYGFLRVNYANGDMVGHTGNYEATKKAVETVDLQIGRLIKECEKNEIVLIVTADHGNADEMYMEKRDENGNLIPKTSHTLNLVPFIIYNLKEEVKLKQGLGLANIASTVVKILGFEEPKMWEEAIF